MTVKCRWCGREDVEVTAKGGLGNHATPGGLRCFAVGLQVSEDTRTPPKRIKGTLQRNSRRKRPREKPRASAIDETAERTRDPPPEWTAVEIEAALARLGDGLASEEECASLAGLGYAAIDRDTRQWILTSDGKDRARMVWRPPLPN
jgi:hypothetical protein